GMGINAMNLSDKTGLLAAQLTVSDDEDILLITDDGTIIRMAVADIRQTGRSAQGVRLMRIAEGAQIVAVARAEQETDEDEELEEAIEQITQSDEHIIDGSESGDDEI
ncbi:MAG: DNA gyrase subunit A, partial [Clostridia bacterium]|nr:DNA gyrase subunit A [Clostridia bacterium]